jgi:hypothetical protein
MSLVFCGEVIAGMAGRSIMRSAIRPSLGDVLQTGTVGLCESAVAAALCRRSPKKCALESKLIQLVSIRLRQGYDGTRGRGVV